MKLYSDKPHCLIPKPSSAHCNQIFTGFYALWKMGLINLSLNTRNQGVNSNIFDVIVNNNIRVRYDLLDGFNWGKESETENLTHFGQLTANCNFYFKRSFQPILENHTAPSCKVMPLGFNFNVVPSALYFFKSGFSSLIYTPKVLLEWLGSYRQENLAEQHFAYPPKDNSGDKILFYTRLWDPDEHSGDSDFSEHLQEINNSRIKAIDACKKYFGNQFKGGLYDSPIARKLAPDLILGKRDVRKLNYLKKVKESSICISTAGLHNSTGWKMAEYIAASRAIVSEPLYYSTAGDFRVNQNYLEFNSSDTLIEQVDKLVENPDFRKNMMNANYNYYNNFLRPDQLVMNTLNKINEYE